MSKCLLIKTKDKKFLTHIKNMSQLIEFSKTFEAEVYVAEAAAGTKILEMKALTEAICNSEFKTPTTYKVIQKVYPETDPAKKKLMKESSRIKKFIKSQLLTGNAISVKDIKDKYKEVTFTDPQLRRHITIVKDELSSIGYKLVKVSAGVYCIEK